jgi:hypothetical protein
MRLALVIAALVMVGCRNIPNAQERAVDACGKNGGAPVMNWAGTYVHCEFPVKAEPK